MAHVRILKPWQALASEITAEHLYFNRRRFLKTLGIGIAGARASLLWSAENRARRNSAYLLDRPITDEKAATNYNNFSEFTDQKENIAQLAEHFRTEPWMLKISGLVHKAQIIDLEQLRRSVNLEERLYRMRCVEGWSMAVPWTGFPLSALIKSADPLPEAKFVRFVSFLRPDQAPAQRSGPKYSWPRFQALTMAEAMNELTILATGIYGRELPKQNGAPIRLVVPWKYGFKSLKSITEIEFLERQPQMFYNNQLLPPDHFIANVNPSERYMGRSQSVEKLIGSWEVRPTLMYNGYGSFVAHLYR